MLTDEGRTTPGWRVLRSRLVRAQYELTYSKYVCYESTHVVYSLYLDIVEIVMLMQIPHPSAARAEIEQHFADSNNAVGVQKNLVN